MLRGSLSVPTRAEEKTGELPSMGVKSYEKIKWKLSAATVVITSNDGDQVPKCAMHQNLSNDSSSNTCDAHGFRPACSNSLMTPRNKPDTDIFSTGTLGGIVRVDERVLTKTTKRLNICGTSRLSCQSPVTKGPYSTFLNFPCRPVVPDGCVHRPWLDNVQFVYGDKNFMHFLPAGPSSCSVRPPKVPNSNKENKTSPTSHHNEAQIFPKGFPPSYMSTRSVPIGNKKPLLLSGVSNGNRPLRMNYEHVEPPILVSRSKELRDSKKKFEYNCDIDDSRLHTAQIFESMSPFKMNEVLMKEKFAEGTHSEGWTRMGPSLTTASILPKRGNMEIAALTNPLQSKKPSSDKITSTRKAGRPRRTLDSKALAYSKNADCDREELSVAAYAAHHASDLACSSQFWKDIEPVFASVCSENAIYLQQQLSSAEDLAKDLSQRLDADNSMPSPDGGEHGEIDKKLVELQKELYEKVCKTKTQLAELDKAIHKEREEERRKLEQLAMDKLVEIGFKKYVDCHGKRGLSSKPRKEAALAFVKRTNVRCKEFEDTGKSCFSGPSPNAALLFAPQPCSSRKRHLTVPISLLHDDWVFPAKAEGYAHDGDKLDRGMLELLTRHLFYQDFPKIKPKAGRERKRKVVDGVGSTAMKTTMCRGNVRSGKAKRKRKRTTSGRDEGKETSNGNSISKDKCHSSGNVIADSTQSANPIQKTDSGAPSGGSISEAAIDGKAQGYEVELPLPAKAPSNSSKKLKGPVDYTNLDLLELNLGKHQDIGPWLGEDGVEECDSVGLEIPKDDLSDVNIYM